MRRIISKPCVPVMFLLALNALPLWGQAVANATIAGTVIDANGGLVPNAQITATQTETGMSRTTASGDVYKRQPHITSRLSRLFIPKSAPAAPAVAKNPVTI